MNIKTNLIKRIRNNKSRLDDTSTNVNIFRRIVSVSQDLLRLLSLPFPLYGEIARWIRFPALLLNTSLQMLVVIFDRNYPKIYKVVMVSLIVASASLTIGIWCIAPNVTACLVGLTIATHLVTLFYRGTKLIVSLQNYVTQPVVFDSEPANKLIIQILIKYRTLKELITRRERQDLSEEDLISDINQYCDLTETKRRNSDSYIRVIDNCIGVTVLVIRGVAAILFLTACIPSLSLPLLLISLVCNACDLIRNTYSKIRNSANLSNREARETDLIIKIEAFTNEYIETNHYEQILQALSGAKGTEVSELFDRIPPITEPRSVSIFALHDTFKKDIEVSSDLQGNQNDKVPL